MNHKWFFSIPIALCLLLVVFSSYSSFQNSVSHEKNMEVNAKLLETIGELKEKLEMTQSRIEAVEEAVNRYSGLSASTRALLISSGHSDPEGYLLNALKDKENLIQSVPVLGGAFFFTKIVILRDDLAFAEFEDGHISGYVLLAFQYDGVRDQVDVSNIFEFLE